MVKCLSPEGKRDYERHKQCGAECNFLLHRTFSKTRLGL